MIVDEGNIQVMDGYTVEMGMENCPITIPTEHNLAS